MPLVTGTDLLGLRDTVEALLRDRSNLDVWVADVTDARLDPDGRAHPYAVLYTAPGRHDTSEEALCGAPGPLAWTFQVTAAGGDETRALWATQEVLDALLDARPQRADRIRLAFNPGPVQRDRSVTPHRWYCPLTFTVNLT